MRSNRRDCARPIAPVAGRQSRTASPSSRSTSTQSRHSPSSRPWRRWTPTSSKPAATCTRAARGVRREDARGELVVAGAARPPRTARAAARARRRARARPPRRRRRAPPRRRRRSGRNRRSRGRSPRPRRRDLRRPGTASSSPNQAATLRRLARAGLERRLAPGDPLVVDRGQRPARRPASRRARGSRRPLELEPAPLPRPDAAVDDVPDVLGAEPLREARGHRGALARGADHRERRRGVDPVRQRVAGRGTARGSSRGCGRRPTRSARARRAPALPRPLASARAAPAPSAAAC